jgi:CheY-like chemotaxis protein
MSTILIIEDSRFTRSSIAKALKANGYEVLEAENGALGLAMILKHSPDIVISDLLMPEMDGFELLETLRSQGSAIPVIIMSADIQETTRSRVLELGARTLLNKPFQGPALMEALQNLGAGKGAPS